MHNTESQLSLLDGDVERWDADSDQLAEARPPVDRCEPTFEPPDVGDAIWTLEALRLPSGDKLCDGWVIEWGGWW